MFFMEVYRVTKCAPLFDPYYTAYNAYINNEFVAADYCYMFHGCKEQKVAAIVCKRLFVMTEKVDYLFLCSWFCLSAREINFVIITPTYAEIELYLCSLHKLWHMLHVWSFVLYFKKRQSINFHAC